MNEISIFSLTKTSSKYNCSQKFTFNQEDPPAHPHELSIERPQSAITHTEYEKPASEFSNFGGSEELGDIFLFHTLIGLPLD